ncbi:Agmatine coumaroyltransferase-2 [Apostasia shenzhenica]|uniref:Agmatine coumaroyltransferase-2 n=1 Tax=Apostasia shenzhenica TaxID=1088818 RepID=A0A2I0A8E4_9ASPA|nr:Agmatine coumaroyltransferase-2 [Apostasia shenzhenica]
MEVQLQRSFTIPSPPKNTDPTELPLTVFDRFASNIYIAVLFAFSPPTPTNSHLIGALSETLHLHFPSFTARLTPSHLVLAADPGGALVVEAAVASSLEYHLPLLPSPEFALLHPPTEGASHLLQVQLNRFRCGGLVVGISAHHRIADGQTMSAFYVAWGRISRGLPVDPVPTYDLSWLTPRSPAKLEFEHWGTEFIADDDLSVHPNNFIDPGETSNVLLQYSEDYITTKLKLELKGKFSTFEVLLGHLWRKITQARGLAAGEETMIRVSVNGRQRLRPPVPKEFIGNLVMNAYPTAKAGDLIAGGLASAAQIIRLAVRRIDDGYIRSFIDFGEVHKEEDLVPVYDRYGNLLSPNLEVDSWLGFEFQEVDFGGGGALRAFLPTWVPMDGLVILLPRFGEGGGVDVVVALTKEHAENLKKISHSL